MRAAGILGRPEFAILRRLDAEQLGRIRPQEAERARPRSCPMAQATREVISGGYHLAVLLNARVPAYEALSARAFRTLKSEAHAFIDSWDGGLMRAEDLEVAVAAALAKKGGAQ